MEEVCVRALGSSVTWDPTLQLRYAPLQSTGEFPVTELEKAFAKPIPNCTLVEDHDRADSDYVIQDYQRAELRNDVFALRVSGDIPKDAEVVQLAFHLGKQAFQTQIGVTAWFVYCALQADRRVVTFYLTPAQTRVKQS